MCGLDDPLPSRTVGSAPSPIASSERSETTARRPAGRYQFRPLALAGGDQTPQALVDQKAPRVCAAVEALALGSQALMGEAKFGLGLDEIRFPPRTELTRAADFEK